MNVVTKSLIRRVAAENWSATHSLDGWRSTDFSAMRKSTDHIGHRLHPFD
jgi:hypothetical protein